MSVTLEQINKENTKADLPEVRAGDTVTVNFKVIEGNKERIQPFKGVVIQLKNAGVAKTVTVRKISGQIAVERIFPVHSPRVESIVVERKGKVRQAKIYYMRERSGKSARIKERK
ncbi:MAG: 50S ribosomal protein L19 [Fibrobacterales bacterium]